MLAQSWAKGIFSSRRKWITSDFDRRIAVELEDLADRENATVGGAMLTEIKELIVRATGCPP
jgi:hypothetical protein